MEKKNDWLQSKFRAIGAALKTQFLERDTIVDGLIVALLARQHVLLLGPPGTAKSALANAVCGAIHGASYFQWLLTRYSTPEEVFGPVSLSGLKEDKFRRVTTGKLPEAHVAFLDETFKANSAILNALLTAINERRYHNNGGAVPIPLETLIGASNELPEGGATGELAPLFDRFLLRFWVEPLKQDSSFISLLTRTSGPDVDAVPQVTCDELHVSQQQVRLLSVAPAVAMELAKVRRELATAGLVASDRRWCQVVTALQAQAWLDGSSEVTQDHFGVLSHCLWDDPERRSEVATTVTKFCGQHVADAMRIHDSLVGMLRKGAGTKADEDGTKAGDEWVSRAAREGKIAEEKLAKLLDEAPTETSKDAIRKLAGQVKAELLPIRQQLKQLIGLGF